MDELKNFTLQLTLTPKLGPKKISSLIDQAGSIYNLYSAYKKGELLNLNLANLDFSSWRNDLQKNNINCSFIWEDSYPHLLKQCSDAPIVLYYVGNKNLLDSDHKIAIVGTRSMTSYGKQILENLVPSLQKTVIVSGMAYGVDAYTHKLAIKNNISTIAVLPFSCHVPTPSGNSSLYKKILEHGNLAISEFPPGEYSHSRLFPRRNRIIAGLCEKTIIIEGSIKSGSLITADLAFNYNRDVFAYPGNIGSIMSEGCNYLIKNNIASLITGPSDVGFGNIAKFDVENLSEIEKKIYYAILRGSKSLSELSQDLKCDVGILSSICTNLQINGILNTDDQNKVYII